VDIKELSGHLRAFFRDVKITQRPIVITASDRERFIEQYRADLEIKKKLKIKGPGAEEEDEEDEELRAKRAEEEKEGVEELVKEARAKKTALPKLSVYLTRRKPKSRMTDAHKTGSRINLPNAQGGLFGVDDVTVGEFEASLRDVPDALIYLGLVVLKLPQDPPKTVTAGDPVLDT
jgi:hypothetical protein